MLLANSIRLRATILLQYKGSTTPLGQYQYIKIFVVRVCVTDVGVAITNLRVVCKTITCASAFTITEMAIIIS